VPDPRGAPATTPAPEPKSDPQPNAADPQAAGAGGPKDPADAQPEHPGAASQPLDSGNALEAGFREAVVAMILAERPSDAAAERP
jgi:hypothetical protein